MNVSIVIPNYNGEKLLKENIPILLDIFGKYKGGKKEIVIMDDASRDKSIKTIESLINSNSKADISISFAKNKKNLGFSSTVNKGVSKTDCDIVILFNTDVVPSEDFLKSILPHFKNSKVFAVGCMDKSYENGKVVLRGRGEGKWKRGFLVHKKGDLKKKNTLWVSGGSGAFRKKIWEKLGGLDTLYNPFYWEDIDLSYRARKAGYEVIFEQESVVDHYHEKGAIKSSYTPFKIKTIAYRNQFIFIWKNATDIDLRILHILWLPYHFVKALLRGDLPFFFGFFKAFILLPKIIKSSIKAQKLFIKTDAEVIKGAM